LRGILLRLHDAHPSRPTNHVLSRRVIPAAASAVLLSLTTPPALAASSVRTVALTLPATARQGQLVTLPTVTTRHPFSLVGLHWSGAVNSRLWLQARDGRWVVLDHAGQTPRAGGQWLTEPVWTGATSRLVVRVKGRISSLRAVLVAPGQNPVIAPVRPGRPNPLAVPLVATAPSLTQPPTPPPVVLRAGWGADEALRVGQPQYAPRVAFVVIHHTLTPNGYSPSQTPQVIRAIYLYQVRGSGYPDIGYNFLVDRAGVVYEGRYGGVTRNVIGQATPGFDRAAVSIAMIGDYRTTPAGGTQLAALEHLIAWRMDVAHADPAATLRIASDGNELYPKGTIVTLPAIAGARDAGPTDSPGSALYAQLGGVRRAVNATAALRIFAPTLTPATITPPFSPVRFTARLSAAATWMVSVTTTAGAVVWAHAGSGASVDATWAGSVIGGGAIPRASLLSWQITAQTPAAQARGAQGLFDGSGAPQSPTTPGQPAGVVASLIAAPSVLTALANTQTGPGVVSWRQLVGGAVRVSVVTATGQPVVTIHPATHVPAGPQSVTWNAAAATGAPLPSGHYQYRLELQPDGSASVLIATVPFDIRRQLVTFGATPRISPKGSVVPAATVGWQRIEAGDAQLRLLRRGRVVTNIALLYDQAPGAFTYQWGGNVPDGAYTLQLLVPGAGGPLVLTRPLVVDTVAPHASVHGVAVGHHAWWVDLRVDKQAMITLRDTNGVVIRTLTAAIARRFSVKLLARRVGVSRRLEIDAQDALGNIAAPLIVTLPRLRH
jgi:hypothetical protein